MNRLSVFIIVLGVAALSAVSAAGTEIGIPALTAAPGGTVSMPVMIDKVDNLAGIKLAIAYDKNLLTFKKAAKSKHTSPLMHVVNDKNPGKLIIVMAGARGIKGSNFHIITLTFDVAKNPAPSEKTSQIQISDVQMMTDKLKNIDYKIKVNPLTISSGKTGKKEKAAPVEKPPSSGEKKKKSG